jgi:hypothetical protein
VTPTRRSTDRQDIEVRPDGSLWDRNALRMLKSQWAAAAPKPAYVARLSKDDPEIREFEATSRERAA